jgi:hypothetical protein
MGMSTNFTELAWMVETEYRSVGIGHDSARLIDK